MLCSVPGRACRLIASSPMPCAIPMCSCHCRGHRGQTCEGVLGTLIFKHRIGFLWWETHNTLGEGYSMSDRINVTGRAETVPNKYVFEEEKLVT